tara:strand:- start:12226 stop:13662 length:1437 start_codon:yes stop_codon:yes gene_type:complete
MPKIFIIKLLILISFIGLSQEVNIEHLNHNINSIGSELNFSQINMKKAYFSSAFLEKDKYQSLIFETELINDNWTRGKYLNLGDSFNYANPFFFEKEKFLYFTIIDNIGNSKIAYRDINKSKNIILNNKINIENSINTHGHRTIFNNIDVFYFSSNRKGGFGGMDIWFSIIDKFGQFGEPINAGNRINTNFDEITPFYNTWTGELYFSSNINEKVSGFDIYKSKGSLNYWNSSIKIDELCSNLDDLYISFFDSISGYFSSNRPPSLKSNDSNCCNDIFSFKYPKLNEKKITPPDSIIKQLPISLFFHNDEPKPLVGISKRSTESTYKDCYISYYKLKSEYYQINNNKIIYDFFESILKKNYVSLNNTLKYILIALNNGKNIELHIKGYASPLHEKEYNIDLSKRRITSVINYINKYNNSSFQKYIKWGNLKIIELPLGENKAKLNVSDNPNNRKKSVYSLEAMLERKIEIVQIIENHQ